MKAIYASKLYRSSTRKSKIYSAINNPINVELVQQLREYLDEDEYSETSPTEDYAEDFKYSSDSEDTSNEVETTSEGTTEDTTETSFSGTTPRDTSKNSSDTSISKETLEDSDSSKITELDTSENESTKETDNLSEKVDTSKFHSPKQKEVTDVENSTSVSGSETIESATALYTEPVESSCHCICDYVDVEAIRGTLNVREDTQGVSRIFIKEKENELWIYYHDKVNLNSVMEPVISVLNSSGFTNLEFNRLARTDNAIVFEVSCVFNPVEPIKSDE